MMEDIAQKLSSSDIILAQLQSSPQKEKLLIIQEILQRNESLLLEINNVDSSPAKVGVCIQELNSNLNNKKVEIPHQTGMSWISSHYIEFSQYGSELAVLLIQSSRVTDVLSSLSLEEKFKRSGDALVTEIYKNEYLRVDALDLESDGRLFPPESRSRASIY